MRYLFCIAFNQCRFVCRLLPRREILAPFLPFLCLRDLLFDLLRRVRLPPFVAAGAPATAPATVVAGATVVGGAGNCAVANKFGGAGAATVVVATVGVVATAGAATVVVAGFVAGATAVFTDSSTADASVFACAVLIAATCVSTICLMHYYVANCLCVKSFNYK